MQILTPSVRIVDPTSDCIQAIFCRHLGPNWVAHLGLLVSLKKPPICQVFVRDLDRTSVPMGPICTQDGSDLSANFLDFVRIGIGVGPHFRYEFVRVRIGDMLGFARVLMWHVLLVQHGAGHFNNLRPFLPRRQTPGHQFHLGSH